MPTKLTTEILSAALAGYEEEKKRINAQIAGLRQMLTVARQTALSTADKTQTQNVRRSPSQNRCRTTKEMG